MTIFVADDILVETWNQFAELDEELPRDLRLQQLVWFDNSVWIVEYPLSIPHEVANSCISQKFILLEGGITFGHVAQTGPGPNEQQVTYAPDYSFGPFPTLPGIQVPEGVRHGWVTLIVEVMYMQQWQTVYPKVAMYRQLPGIQYIFCLKLSARLNLCSYELYEVGNNDSTFPNPAIRVSFDIRTVQPNHPFVVQFDSRRVLALPADGELPRAGKTKLRLMSLR